MPLNNLRSALCISLALAFSFGCSESTRIDKANNESQSANAEQTNGALEIVNGDASNFAATGALLQPLTLLPGETVKRYSAVCTATLLCKDVAITVGHCKGSFSHFTLNNGNPRLSKVLLPTGSIAIQSLAESPVIGLPENQSDRFMLLKLQTPVTGMTTFPQLATYNPTNPLVTVVGYGMETFGDIYANAPLGTKKQATLKVTQYHSNYLTLKSQLGPKPQAFAAGDSGGPVLTSAGVVGVVANSFEDIDMAKWDGTVLHTQSQMDWLNLYLSNMCTSRTIKLTVSLEVDGQYAPNYTAAGRVTASGGLGTISCGNGGYTCSAEYTLSPTKLSVNGSLTATPLSGYRFSGWKDYCAGAGVTPHCLISALNGTRHVVASFTKIGSAQGVKSISVARSGNGSGLVKATTGEINCGNGSGSLSGNVCSATLAATKILNLEVNLSSGTTFGGWTGDCAGAGTNTTCTISVDGVKSVGVVFNTSSNSNIYQLSVSATGAAGSGTVSSPTNGISCNSNCSYNVNANTVVNLTATASPNSDFSSWTGACAGNYSNTCSLSMNAAKSTAALFTLKPNNSATFTLTTTFGGMGSGRITSAVGGINCTRALSGGANGPTCSAAFAQDTLVTLTAVALNNSAFSQWTGSCQTVSGNTCTVKMNAIKTIGAIFNFTN